MQPSPSALMRPSLVYRLLRDAPKARELLSQTSNLQSWVVPPLSISSQLCVTLKPLSISPVTHLLWAGDLFLKNSSRISLCSKLSLSMRMRQSSNSRRDTLAPFHHKRLLRSSGVTMEAVAATRKRVKRKARARVHNIQTALLPKVHRYHYNHRKIQFLTITRQQPSISKA